ncbi:MAG TPA: 3-deoxy-7-phosphoheptulonate synthase [Candidatus Saccharimonadales bacterium]|nr:3-deoxy-7-phosphoheptulonate synthase [Candidatus Saccharimonadales bacterium]
MTIEPLLSATRRHDTHQVNIGALAVGGDTVPVIAGPCAVEPGYVEHAIAAHRAGASALRGCVFKPRTRPGSFQGLGSDGLPLLDEARRITGLPVIAEPLAGDDIELLRGHADALLIGARAMHNTPLLRAAGQSGMTIMLKRGMSATYDEWLAAADYITAEGNRQVILCERGIRTFETATRNTLDVSAITVLRDMTDLPIAVDPSHAAGNSRWVPSLAVAALAAGADALLIECHPNPAESLCDAAQAITPPVLSRIVQTSLALCAMTRPAVANSLTRGREVIDTIDETVFRMLEYRAAMVEAVQHCRLAASMPSRDPAREREIVTRLSRHAPRLGEHRVDRLVHTIIDECLDAAQARPQAVA